MVLYKKTIKIPHQKKKKSVGTIKVNTEKSVAFLYTNSNQIRKLRQQASAICEP